MRRWIFKLAVFLALVAGFFAALLALRDLAVEYLRRHDRYLMEFSDIACEPPPGLSRSDFLDEVQYYSSLPTRLPVLDADLRQRLAEGFAKHPWVESVAEVTVSGPRQVQVRCHYRRAVLAVRVGDIWRAVDRHGILLPSKALTADLPRYEGQAPAPTGPEGTPWGDTGVAAAAARAAQP